MQGYAECQDIRYRHTSVRTTGTFVSHYMLTLFDELSLIIVVQGIVMITQVSDVKRSHFSIHGCNLLLDLFFSNNIAIIFHSSILYFVITFTFIAKVPQTERRVEYNCLFNTPSVSKQMSILEINFVSQYLSISSFNATLIIVLSIIPLYIYYRERKNRMK